MKENNPPINKNIISFTEHKLLYRINISKQGVLERLKVKTWQKGNNKKSGL